MLTARPSVCIVTDMNTATATQTTAARADRRCPGCGKSFTGERGLRAHQSARFQAAACKPRQDA